MTFPLADLWFGGPPEDPGKEVGDRAWGDTPRVRDASVPDTPAHALEPIVQRLRAGDERALREIWDAQYARLVGIARRYMPSDDQAVDVVQHVFITLWDRRATVAPRRTLAAHLAGAVRFRALHELRQTRLHDGAIARSREGSDDISTVPNFGEIDVDVAEIRAAIQAALATLPPRAREIFVMHRDGGLTAPEIAEVLGIRTQVVYNQLSRALKALAVGLKTLR